VGQTKFIDLRIDGGLMNLRGYAWAKRGTDVDYTYWILNGVCNSTAKNVTVVSIKLNACAEAVCSQL
jgi:hypothetical protein